MKLQFLGTSAGTPTKTRNVTALALGYAQRSNWYLIDLKSSQREIKTEAGRFYKGPLFIAHDLDIYHLDRDGGLTQT